MSDFGMHHHAQQRELSGLESGSKQQENQPDVNFADTASANNQEARSPERAPMIQLSPNAVNSPAQGSSPLVFKVQKPAASNAALLASKFGGSTTHRDGRQTPPMVWQPGSGSGCMTARGKALILLKLCIA